MNQLILGNSPGLWAAAVTVTLVLVTVLLAVKRILVQRLQQMSQNTATYLDDVLARVLAVTSPLVVAVVAVYAGSLLLVLPAETATLLRSVLVIAAFLQIALWGSRGIRVWLEHYMASKRQSDAASATVISVLGLVARIAVWSVVVLLIADNLGFDITALVAGLGIGGVAIALAVQNVLGDIFASVSIALDKPFVIGDFIVVGDMLGTVEYIGIKTTRLRSLSGEQLVISNSDLLSTRIRNYKRMFERRVVQTIGVVYQTPVEQVEAIPDILRAAVESRQGARFDRAHFAAFGESALVFEMVYFVCSPDYNTYMDIQQAINRRILMEFRQRGLEFAYPTRTVFTIPQET